MLYDIRTTPEQLAKLGEWVTTGEGMADVELVVDDSMLLAEQGDERMAWDTDGSLATDEYLAVAPLDPSPQNFLIRKLATMLWPERYPEGHPWHNPEHVFWDQRGGTHALEPDEEPYQWSADTIEWVAAAVNDLLPEGYR